ncbi:MAG: AAA family ATPase [Prevotella sp.]|nr:AAA family ATPase [Prevotella sp.]
MVPYFNIIQTLCRAAGSDDKENVEYNIQRLVDAYKKDGHEKEAKTLEKILKSSQKVKPMVSATISASSALEGEILTEKTPVPVDKETAAPILEVIFDNGLPQEEPLFNDQIKEAVGSVVLEWTNYSKLVKMNATPSRSCLIYGDPGTGKTHLAKWIAKRVGLPVVLAKLDGIVSSFLGTSSRNISNLFKFANRYKCVLLLDEFDAIAKLRDDPQEVGEVKRIVNTLLQCLDDRDEVGFTIGVTNHEQLLDPAIWRRFDVQIEIPKPSDGVLPVLIKKFVKPLEYNEAEVQFLSWCLQGATGADVQKMANWLKRMSIIPEYKNQSLVRLMQRYVLLNTGRVSKMVKEALDKPLDEMVRNILNDNPTLKQKDLAEMFNLAPSSISKLKKKEA